MLYIRALSYISITPVTFVAISYTTGLRKNYSYWKCWVLEDKPRITCRM